MGSGSEASGTNAIALGSGSQATANNSVALGANSVATRENTVSVGSVGNERQITNVAAGTQPTDAVNLSQLNAVASSLSYQIANVRNGAYSAAAASMAVQSAPYVPGHTTLRLGGGAYGGQGALGLTMRRTSDDGSWSIDGGITTTSFGTGGQIGISAVLP